MFAIAANRMNSEVASLLQLEAFRRWRRYLRYRQQACAYVPSPRANIPRHPILPNPVPSHPIQSNVIRPNPTPRDYYVIAT